MRRDEVTRHLNTDGSKCADDPSAKNYGIFRENGRVPILRTRFYNRYFLGLMENYECSELEFEYMASRKRYAPLDLK